MSPENHLIAEINYFPATNIPIPTKSWQRRFLGVGDPNTRSMAIRDIRSTTKSFDLDTHGFQFVKLPPRRRITGKDDEDTIKREYYPELVELTKRL